MKDRRHRKIALLVSACFFMELLDGTIVTTSAAKIAHSLSVAPSSISLIITAYLVTLAALIPLSGWASARWGARPVFLGAIFVFAIASLGCALSTSLPELIGMRVLQGAGGAMMVPVGRFVVLARTAKADLMKMTAYIVWPALLAPVIAPLAGGAITTYANWHWLFLINVPLALVAFIAAFRLIESPPQEAPPRLDRLGVALSCTGLATLMGTAGLLANRHPDWSVAVPVGVVAAALLALAVRHLLRTPAPVLNLRTLRIHTFGAAVRGMSTYSLVIGAGPFLLPLLFQEVFGWSAVKSGSVVLFLFLGNIGIKPATTFLYRRFGFRAILVLSTSCMAVTMVAAAFMTAATPLPLIAAVLAISGVARSVGATGYTTIAFTDVPADQMRDANTLQATVQQLAGGFGVAVATIFLTAGGPLARLLGDGSRSAGYSVAFILLGVVSLYTTSRALRLHPSAGDVLRGDRAVARPRPAMNAPVEEAAAGS